VTDRGDTHRWRALAICLVGGFMVLLDVSIVNVALPSIRSGLGAAQSELQWVVSGYALAFGLVLVPAGRIGDLRGRRTMFVVALGLFTLSSAACGAAQDSLFLVIARFIQGFAGGTLTPQISALIQELFEGEERGRAFGWFGTVVGISTAIGPLLGGLLIAAFGDTEGWRAVFFVNVPIGLAAMPIAWRLLPAHSHTQQSRHDLDPLGVGLLAAGAVTLLLPLVEEQQWKGATKWLLVPLAALILAAFVLWELGFSRRGKEPLVDFDLFRRRSYSFGAALATVYFAAFTPLFFVFTLYLQTGEKYSALLAGLAITPFAVGSGAAAALGGRIVQRFGRPLVVLGLVGVAVGYGGVLLAADFAPHHDTGWAMLAPLLLAGLGSGLVITPNQTLTLSQVPVARSGTAGGLLQTGQRIGAAIGIAAVGSVFFSSLGSSRGDYPRAFRDGLIIALVFIAVALVIAVSNVVVNRAVGGHHGDHRLSDADGPIRPEQITTAAGDGTARRCA
jgi:EmrB/QacA subfamily drug resistance transporter